MKFKGEWNVPRVKWNVGSRVINATSNEKRKKEGENFLVSEFSTFVESSFHYENVVFEVSHKNYLIYYC